jgi:tRNA A-37 threonylcarbamoyl transferase component Bud32
LIGLKRNSLGGRRFVVGVFKEISGTTPASLPGTHLLYALTCGIEEIHLLNEIHGDLHTDNIIVNRFGLEFEVKLLDLFNGPIPKKETRQQDICELIRIFYDTLGGAKRYSKMPDTVKEICCGLKRSLIVDRFRTISYLREHLESLDWSLDMY